MWFEKLFGRHRKIEHPAKLNKPARPTRRDPDRPHPAVGTPSEDVPRSHQGEGFDPYNSGAFQKRNAWERVARR